MAGRAPSAHDRTMTGIDRRTPPSRRGRGDHASAQIEGRHGDALVTWALWGLTLLAMLVTYTRLDPEQLYHVSRDGIDGGLSRVLVALNFPIALIVIALVLVAMDPLPKRAWWIGAPAIVLCAVTALPGVVDDQDLDARLVNVVPAVGVALGAGLAVAAARRTSNRLAARQPFDRVRWAVAGVSLVLSLPWIFAELGMYAPEWLFITERPIVGADGSTSPAVHLGHHHGLDGALFVVSAVLLSRLRLRSPKLTTATTRYVSLVFAYGAVNLVQDVWNEQLVKRGWIDWKIPSALTPAPEPIWLVILLVAAATAVVLRAEARRSAVSHESDAGTAAGTNGPMPVTEGPLRGVHDGTS
jgi:hypothetical protein